MAGIHFIFGYFSFAKVDLSFRSQPNLKQENLSASKNPHILGRRDKKLLTLAFILVGHKSLFLQE